MRYGTTRYGLARYAAPNPPPPAPIPYTPHRELAGWLSNKIGRPVNLGRFVQGTQGVRISYHVIDEDTPMTLAGPCPLSCLTIQIDVFADEGSPEDAGLAQRAIYQTLAGYRGATGRAWLDSAIPGRTLTDYIPAGGNAAGGTFRETREWSLWLA